MILLSSTIYRKKRVFGVEFHERNKRDTRLHPWGVGVPPRTDNSKRREAVFVDGLLSLDGIPIGVEGRGAIEERKGREEIISPGTHRKIMWCGQHRIFSTAYVSIALFIGVVWQILSWIG
jgi:hypothetical protein